MIVANNGIQLTDFVIPRTEKSDPSDSHGVPYIGLDDVEAHSTKLLGSKDAITMKSSAKAFYKGDVLYSRLRPYLNKVWLADRNGLCSAEFIILPENEWIDGRFLKYRLNARDFVTFANSLNAGDRPRVDFDQISSFIFPPFSLAQQRRIVAKIEELFSELDDGIASLKTARAQLKIYRQALLKHAFEGKLTEQWRKDHADQLESADQLLARIAKEREAHYQKQLKDWKQAVKDWESKPDADKRPPKPNQLKRDQTARKSSSRELPAGWHDLKLSDLVASIGQGWSPKCEKNPATCNEWGVIKTTAIQPLRFNVAENKALPSSLRPRKWLQIEVGDILITRAGPRSRCGIVCRVVDTQPRIMLCDKAYLLRFPNSEIAPAYIEALLNSPDLTHAIEKLKTGINDSGVNITQTGFLDLQVQIPPFKEQIEIHRILEVQISQIAHMEQDIEEQLQKSEALRQSILKKAFSGQLVPQDPADEPASVLLERIRAERAQGATGKTPSKSTGKIVRNSKAIKKFT